MPTASAPAEMRPKTPPVREGSRLADVFLVTQGLDCGNPKRPSLHAGCRCLIVPGLRGRTVLGGYDPSVYYRGYLQLAKHDPRGFVARDDDGMVLFRDGKFDVIDGTVDYGRERGALIAVRSANTEPKANPRKSHPVEFGYVNSSDIPEAARSYDSEYFAFSGLLKKYSSLKYSNDLRAAISKCIKADRPIFDEGRLCYVANQAWGSLSKSEDYVVVLHGSQLTVNIFGVRTDHRVLPDIIRSRDDYNGERVMLIPCSTGSEANKARCFAKRLAIKLGKVVLTPSNAIQISSIGEMKIKKNGIFNLRH